MKMKSYMAIMISALMIFLIVNGTIVERKKEMNILLLPSLPRPIAEEYALITSAGQGTDAYIINDVANKLMIHNYFMPQARDTDLEGVNTLVFVVGCSSLGEKLHGISFDDEKDRITKLLKKAKKEKLTVITIYIGGKERHEKRTDELLSLIGPESNYLIATRESNYDNFLSELAKSGRVPLTLINRVNDISEPFASAFR